jgi:TRAP-type C4-dicarboxylate transport system permease small subunit
MKTRKHLFSTGIEGLSRVLCFSGQLALAVMVVTICYDVVMRYIFAAPTLWSLEVNTFLVVFVTLIPAGDVLRTDSHLRITFFLDKMPPRVRNWHNKLISGCGVAFCAFMTWKGYQMAMQAFRYNERLSTSLGTPLVIPYLFIPIDLECWACNF